MHCTCLHVDEHANRSCRSCYEEQNPMSFLILSVFGAPLQQMTKYESYGLHLICQEAKLSLQEQP